MSEDPSRTDTTPIGVVGLWVRFTQGSLRPAPATLR
jgi:hypothetical protein